MKSFLRIPLLGLLLMSGTLNAQTPLPLPNGSFEQWTTHQGYGVSVLFFNVPVYSDYSTPTGWDYLAYPVNETFSMMGMNININTTVPVVMTTAETGMVPDSNTAVKLQTIMLSDIVSSTVLNLAGSSLDPSLTTQVIPSILTTGVVDIDAFIPIVSNLLSDTGDILSILPSLLSMDVNDFISGGLPLDGIRPGRLTGSYKYHSAVGGDNGAVIMLGTHYNTTAHKRDIVGLGINLALFDTSLYTPFELEYLPLGAFVPGSPDVQPDTLIVAIVSSASANMQQGSYLCVDNLVLWSAPDTCATILNLAAVPEIHEAALSWNVTAPVDGYELEYGPAGFPQGNGTSVSPTTTSYTLCGLDAGTEYDVYIRTLCPDSVYGHWSLTHFTTLPDTCAAVLGLTVQDIVCDAFPMMELQWYGSITPDRWEVEYGPQGFALGTGTRVLTEQTSFEIHALEQSGALTPNTWYDFYVRSVCQGDLYGDWDSVHYRTFCAQVRAVVVSSDNLVTTADNHISGYSIAWEDNSDNQSWDIYYGIYNSEYPDLPWGTDVRVDTPWFEFPPLQPGATYTVEITPYCGDQNYGNTTWVNFTTATLTGIASVGDSEPGVAVYPNPANGQCEITTSEPALLQLYSLDGRLVKTLDTDGTPILLQLPEPGIFLLRATTANGDVTLKIVSQ